MDKYPYIRAWAKHTNKPAEWVKTQTESAIKDKVPATVIHQDAYGRWTTIYSVESSQQRHILDRLAQE